MKSTVTIDWTLVIAIYAAVVSTTAVLWDFYKWKTAGSNLDAHVATDMKVTGGPSRYGDDTLMILTISNRGDRATTITHLTMHRYPSWWAVVRRRAAQNWFVPDPSEAQRLPFELRPGAVWMGAVHQTEEIEAMARDGFLYLGVVHSNAGRGIHCRVRMRAAQSGSSGS